MRIQKYNFPDTVVWNPWSEKAKALPDFGDDEHPNMISVESGHVSTPVTLMPGTAYEASQILQVSCRKRKKKTTFEIYGFIASLPVTLGDRLKTGRPTES